MKATDDRARWRFNLHEVIFEADTLAGKWFDDYWLWNHCGTEGHDSDAKFCKQCGHRL